MVVTAMSPMALLKTVAYPDEWSPGASQPHGNRPVDKQHVRGIAEYLETEEHFVMGAVMLYAKPHEARFVPARFTSDMEGEEDSEDTSRAGTLYLDYGAEFDIGDGQHRMKGYDQVVQQHRDDGSPIVERLRTSGQPLIVVIDDDPLHRAQDFTDLQRNTKKISTSMGLSMDRRQPSNRLLMELIKNPALGIFGDSGDVSRIEFGHDTPGKFAAKLFSYKAVRIVSQEVLGVHERTAARADKLFNDLAEGGLETRQTLIAFWEALGSLRPYSQVIAGKSKVADLRSSTYLASAQVLYAIGYGSFLASSKHGIGVTEFVGSLETVNFNRPTRVPSPEQPLTAKDTIFAGNLVEPANGRVAGSRVGWEPAAEALVRHALSAR
jgi:DNA sulfur modification protein DndB